MKIKHIVLALSVIFLSGATYWCYRAACVSLIAQFIRDPQKIGTIAPSSRAVSLELAKALQAERGPLKIIEVGAGTGPVTEVIADFLRPGDIFDAVEIDPHLCEILRKKFKHNQQVDVRCVSITDWNPAYKYDVLIVTLPFNNFPPSLVQEILASLVRLSAPGAQLSHIDYIGAAGFKWLVAKLAGQQAPHNPMHDFRKEHNAESVMILFNIPPSYVHHMVMQ